MQPHRPYRFCMLHATASVEILECADDDAKRRAREMLAANTSYRAVEVWDKERLVTATRQMIAGSPSIARQLRGFKKKGA